MPANWLFSTGSPSLKTTVAFVLALLGVSALATYYRSEVEDLTALRRSEAAQAETSYTMLFQLHQREKKEHEAASARVEERNACLVSERDGLRRQLSALQARLDSAPAGECREGGRVLVDHLGRCADLASECAAELRRKEQALKACVRAYEDARMIGGG